MFKKYHKILLYTVSIGVILFLSIAFDRGGNNPGKLQPENGTSTETQNINGSSTVASNKKLYAMFTVADYEKMQESDLLDALDNCTRYYYFPCFTDALGAVYKRGLQAKKEFTLIESRAYMDVTTQYFDKGKVQETLDIATAAFKVSPTGWRFKYLMIRALEKLGRNAFDKKDLKKAEEYAMTILRMEYRPEGANLLADIYIAKINADLKQSDSVSARNDLNYALEIEASQDRKDTLATLKKKLGL